MKFRIVSSMWKPGDVVYVPFDDQEENEPILKKQVKVVEVSDPNPPYWTKVEFEGKFYMVRGSEVYKL